MGRSVDDFDVGPPSEMTWTPDDEDAFAALPTDDGRVPQLLRATVAAPGGQPPPELLIGLNGTVAGVAGGAVADGDRWRVSAYLGPYFLDGANEVTAYEVTSGPDGPVLRRLG